MRESLIFVITLVLSTAFGLTPYRSCQNVTLPRATPTVVKVGYSPDLDAAPHWLAEEAGYFKEEGLAVQFIAYASPVENTRALADGTIDVSISPFTGAFYAVREGVPVRTIASAGGWGVIQVLIQEKTQLTSLDALAAHVREQQSRGAEQVKLRIGSLWGDAVDLLMQDALQTVGLNYEDFELRWYSDRAALRESFKSGAVDLIAHTKPYSTDLIENSGALLLTDNATVWNSHSPNCVVSVLSRLLEDRPKVVQAYLRATLKAAELINTRPDRATALLSNNYEAVGIAPRVMLEAFRSQPKPISFTPSVPALNRAMQSMLTRRYLDRSIPQQSLLRLATIENLEASERLERASVRGARPR